MTPVGERLVGFGALKSHELRRFVIVAASVDDAMATFRVLVGTERASSGPGLDQS